MEEGVGPKATLPPNTPKIAPKLVAPRIPLLQSEIWSNSSAVKFIVNNWNFSRLKTSSTEIAILLLSQGISPWIKGKSSGNGQLAPVNG